MTSLFDKLNLNAQERRLVVITGIVLFVMLNYFFVWPEFGEYGKFDQRIKDASAKLKVFQDENSKRASYESELDDLQKQGSTVATEEAALRLSQEVNSQASLSGVTITSITPLQRQGSGGKTNAFFEEASVTVNINTGERELVEFLYRLADKDMLIRAKSMQLGTDPSRMRLQGQITLVKSFQRKPTPRSSLAKASPAAAPAKTEPAAKPVAKAAPPAASPAAPAPAPMSTNRSRRAPAPLSP